MSIDGLNEARLKGIIAKRVPYLLNSSIDPVDGVHKCAFAPKPFHYLVAINHSPVVVNEQNQQLHRHPLEIDSLRSPQQFVAFPVELKLSEPKQVIHWAVQNSTSKFRCGPANPRSNGLSRPNGRFPTQGEG